jgi:DNA-binding MarR family transcriptional regulator
MSPNRATPARIGAVSDLLGMDRTTLTANLKPLARGGLLTVTADPEDRRSRTLALTLTGRTLLGAAVPLWKRPHAEIERQIARSDPDRLRTGLRALARLAPVFRRGTARLGRLIR